MTKKKDSPTTPEVHRVALPVSDESLVIDLPDGQKLVVGKLATGSVIEVATWRGTGRPDSRTTRLMLGMSSSGNVEDIPVKSEESTPAPQDLVGKAKATLNGLVGKISAIKKPDFGSLKIKSHKKVSTEGEVSKWTPSSPEESTAGEVDKWLEEVMARSQKRAERLANKEQLSGAKKKAPVKKATTKRRAK